MGACDSSISPAHPLIPPHPTPQPTHTPPGSGFSVAFDPLDGSSIVDTNFSVGTIFGESPPPWPTSPSPAPGSCPWCAPALPTCHALLHPHSCATASHTRAAELPPVPNPHAGVWPGDHLTGITGRGQDAAGMGIYGPRTVYVIALKDAPGTHEFLLQDDGKWLHVKETTEIGELWQDGRCRGQGGGRGVRCVVARGECGGEMWWPVDGRVVLVEVPLGGWATMGRHA